MAAGMDLAPDLRVEVNDGGPIPVERGFGASYPYGSVAPKVAYKSSIIGNDMTTSESAAVTP